MMIRKNYVCFITYILSYIAILGNNPNLNNDSKDLD